MVVPRRRPPCAGGRQYITLSLVDVLGGVVANNGLYVHELGHALGLHHEHTRQDRDTYVTVNWFCIQSGQSHNFEKKLGIPLGAYDPTSVMHDRTNTFLAGSFFCRSTLIPKPGVTIAPSNGLSSGDISALNWLASL